MTEQQQRVQRILDGQEKAPNEVVQYLADQVKQLQADSVLVSNQIESTKAQLQNLERSSFQIRGAFQKYVSDIEAWLDRKVLAIPTDVKVDATPVAPAETPPAAN